MWRYPVSLNAEGGHVLVDFVDLPPRIPWSGRRE